MGADMSVRKRKWKTRKREPKEAWIVDYIDGHGDRHIKTFERKRDADQFHASVKVDVSLGVHTPAAKSITVRQASEDWLAWVKAESRERATIANYEQVVAHHIVPRIGNIKLSSLTMPRVQKFRDDLLADMSRNAARIVLVRFKSILTDV